MYRYFYFIPLMLGLLASCNNTPQTLEQMKTATTADSLMYYFGEMQAYSYWQDAQSDTVFKTEDGRKDFMEGFRAGLEMENDNYAYNKGLKEGLRLAIRLRDFQKAYDMTFPEDILADAFEISMNDGNEIDVAAAQKNYYRIKDRLDLERGIREGESSRKALAEAAGPRAMNMVSDTLYARDITPAGTGQKFRDGDKVAISLMAATLNGRQLGRQFPPKIVIGEGRVPRVVCLALHTMTDGQTRSFMTTPRALFGLQYDRYHLTAEDPVIFTVKADRLPLDESTDNTETMMQ